MEVSNVPHLRDIDTTMELLKTFRRESIT
ncbi:hypothetical protein OK016_06845 [Vibrio chagasii]|nr:hypothetical protein [Vibrio chagasii]